MPEIDVKLSQIAPSPISATTATQIVGVQGGATDNLFSQQQLADGPFLSTISSPIAGAISRSHSNRWSDVINVLDFNADPTGVNDSTSAIQAAVTAAGTAGASTSSLILRKIFFPAGNYKVGGTGVGITIPNSGGTRGFWFEGEGLATKITVNPAFPVGTFLFDSNVQASASENTIIFSGFWFQGAAAGANTNGAPSFIRIASCITARIENCQFTAGQCNPFSTFGASCFVSLGPSCFEPTIISCNFIAPSTRLQGPAIGTVGLGCQSQSLMAINCNFIGFDYAVTVANSSANFFGCRWEENNTGLIVGRTPTLVDSNASCGVWDAGFEANSTPIYTAHGAGNYTHVTLTGDPFSSYQYFDSTLSSASWSGSAGGIGTATAVCHNPCGLPRQLSVGATFTGYVGPSSTVLTVASITTGSIINGFLLQGSGVPANTTITSQLTGTPGGAGTYQTSLVNNVTIGSSGSPIAMTNNDPAFVSQSFSATITNVSSSNPGPGYDGTFACTAGPAVAATFTGNTTIGSVSITGCVGTLPAIGQMISGPGLPIATANCVTNVTGSTVVMAFPATLTSTSVFNYNVVGSFSYSLPDPGGGQVGANGGFAISSRYGFRMGQATGSVLTSCSVGGPYSVAPLAWDAGVQAIDQTFISCIVNNILSTAPEVVWPSNPVGITCINSGFTPPDATFNQLAGNPGAPTLTQPGFTGMPTFPSAVIIPALENMTFTISDSPIGTNTVGATFNGHIDNGFGGTGTTLTVDSGLPAGGVLVAGDSIIGNGVTAGTTIRTTNGTTTATVNIPQLVASTTALQSVYENFGVTVNRGSGSARAELRCALAPTHPLATLSDGTHEAIFYGTIGCKVLGSIVIGTSSLLVSGITQGGIISPGVVGVGDIISGGHIPANTTILSQASGTAGGAGTYNLSANATANDSNVTFNVSSTVLNVTDTASSPTFGTINPAAGWTLDLFFDSAGTRTISSQLSGTPGGAGTYRLSGAAIAPVPNWIMGAGLPGTVLTLHGGTNTFQVGAVFTFENTFGYSITSSRTPPPAGTAQWNVTGTSKYFGPQAIYGAVWQIVG